MAFTRRRVHLRRLAAAARTDRRTVYIAGAGDDRPAPLHEGKDATQRCIRKSASLSELQRFLLLQDRNANGYVIGLNSSDYTSDER